MTSDEKQRRDLLADPETCGSVLLTIALSKYKEQAFEVDPMTLIFDLEDDFQTSIPEPNENKLKAILLATETPIFQHDPDAFQAICMTLWEGDPQLDAKEPLTLTEAIWGMFEVKVCYGELALAPGIHALVARLSDDEVQDPEEAEDPYGHVKAGMQERYEAWRGQMGRLGVDAKDLPALEGE